MKKRIFLLLAMLTVLLCICALSASAAEENTIVRYCEYCDLTETWYPFDNTSAIETKHYYLKNNVTFGEKTVPSGTTLCLELNGRIYTANRHMIVNSGAIVNIQDNSGKGTFAGRGSDNYDPGRAIWLKSGGTLNLYSGTMTAATSSARGTKRGGVLAIYGTFNMFGGQVRDGIADEIGGTVFLDTNGLFNMYGGSISGGSAPNSPCCYFRGKVLLGNDASIEHAQVTPNSSQGLYAADQITIRGNYTGSLCMSVYGLESAGTDIGNSDNADLTGSTIYLSGNDMLVKVSGNDLVTYLPDAAAITSGDETVSYETLDSALSALKDGDLLTLYQGTENAVTIDKNITLDLNGRTIKNTLTADEGVTVYIKDSSTDDYTIADKIYGHITEIAGDIRAAEATGTSDPYLMIENANGVSFHAVSLNIHSMTLKPGQAALYFNNTFAGDSMVTEQIASFGVAMSIEGAPDESTMANSKHYTQLDGALFGTDEGNNGSLLSGIMKEENDRMANQRNADITVYGKAYVQLKDGRYLFGVCQSRSLKEQVESAGNQFETLSAEAQDGLMKMLGRFQNVTEKWDIQEVYDYMEHHEEETLKIMIVGNSGAVDAFHLLYKAFQDQYPDQKIVLGVMYYSGCTVAQHVDFYQKESPVYSYRINRDGTWVRHEESTLQDGLTDQQWDIVSIHANKKTTVSKADRDLLAQYISESVTTPYQLYYDYTWPNPNDELFFSEGFDPQPPAGYKDTLIRDFGFDLINQMNVINANVQDILSDGMFDNFVTGAPAFLYALNRLGCTQPELYRDYTHASDFGRLIAAYCWVSQITGEPITEININLIPAANRATFRQQALGDMVVTEEMKQIIMESVNYALENRFGVPLPLES